MHRMTLGLLTSSLQSCLCSCLAQMERASPTLQSSYPATMTMSECGMSCCGENRCRLRLNVTLTFYHNKQARLVASILHYMTSSLLSALLNPLCITCIFTYSCHVTCFVYLQQPHSKTLAVGASEAVFVCEYSRASETARARARYAHVCTTCLISSAPDVSVAPPINSHNTLR